MKVRSIIKTLIIEEENELSTVESEYENGIKLG